MFRGGSSASVVVAGTGAYVPEKILTNDDLSKMVETNDEWIRTRTGIRERRIAAPGETSSVMAEKAGRAALERAGVDPSDIGLLVVATISPDQPLPSTACIMQPKLGVVNAMCFDIAAACSGFVYAFDIAAQYVSNGSCGKALVIGVEKMSSIIDWQDRSTCVLFGDGAGAVVLERSSSSGGGVRSSITGADGSFAQMLRIEAGGCAEPVSPEVLERRGQFVKMEGNLVFKHAVRTMTDVAFKAIEEAGLKPSDISCVIPHQANLRIISAVGEKLGIPQERFVVNIDKYGNTTAASIPLALAEADAGGRIKSGDNVLMVAFGAGLTWGANVVRWGL